MGEEHQEATGDAEILQEHDHLNLICEVAVVQDSRDDAEGGPGEGRNAYFEAQKYRQTYRDLEQNGGPGQKARQTARLHVASKARDVAELAQTRHQKEAADEDTRNRWRVFGKLIHVFVPLNHVARFIRDTRQLSEMPADENGQGRKVALHWRTGGRVG